MWAGAAGGLLLTAGDLLERALLGRAPVYAPNRILSRLLGRRGPHGRGTLLVLSAAMRSAYAMSLGAAYGAARRRLPGAPPMAGVLLGTGIWAFEIVAMPATRATPRIRIWPVADFAMLVAHTLGFGLVTAVAYERLAR